MASGQINNGASFSEAPPPYSEVESDGPPPYMEVQDMSMHTLQSQGQYRSDVTPMAFDGPAVIYNPGGQSSSNTQPLPPGPANNLYPRQMYHGQTSPYPVAPVPPLTTHPNVSLQMGSSVVPAPEAYTGMAWIAYLFCFWPTGIIAIIHSRQVESKLRAGDYQGATRASMLARRYSQVSFVAGSFMYLTILCFIVVASIFSNR